MKLKSGYHSAILLKAQEIEIKNKMQARFNAFDFDNMYFEQISDDQFA